MVASSYNAIDVANYIVWRANQVGRPVTPLKLQKLLYYVVASHIQNYGFSPINEPVYKWQYGPVVKSVYHQFKVHGSSPIHEPSSYLDSNYDFNNPFSLSFVDVKDKTRLVDSDIRMKSIVDLVFSHLLALPAMHLVEKTHQEPAWKNNESLILQGIEIPYTDDEMRAAIL